MGPHSYPPPGRGSRLSAGLASPAVPPPLRWRAERGVHLPAKMRPFRARTRGPGGVNGAFAGDFGMAPGAISRPVTAHEIILRLAREFAQGNETRRHGLPADATVH